MTKMLIDERPIMFLPKLAKALGSCERAIVLQQIHWLCTQPNSGRMIDGTQWVYGTYEEWCRDYFSMWSPHTLSKHIRNLEKAGVLISAQLKAHEHDHTKFYRVNYDHESLQSMLPHPVASEVAIAPDTVASTLPHPVASIPPHPVASMRLNAVDSIYRTETPTETSTETTKERSSSSVSSSSEPEKSKNDDDDDLVFKSVLTAWNEGMPEKATNHVQKRLKELLAECGPAAVIGGILAAADASGRSFKYVATCARNLVADAKNEPPRKTGYSDYNYLLREAKP